MTKRGINRLSPKMRARVGVALVAAMVLGALVFWCGLGTPAYKPVYQGPFGICVTFGEDPVHEAAIHYQSLPGKGPDGAQPISPSAHAFYDTESRDGDPTAYRQQESGRTRTIPGLHDGRFVHRILLKGLDPGRTYYFIVGDATTGYSKEIKFKTLPGGASPLRFVAGGDVGGYPRAEYPYTAALLREAGKCDPQFVVIGGDIAYASGDVRHVERWDKWFENWSRFMVTSDGCTIPIVAAMGNHEANDQPMDNPLDRAPFYTAFFCDDPPYSYHRLKLADYAVLFVLDTNHLAPEIGSQSEWLARELEAAKDLPIKMAAYHVPMYPGYRDFDDGDSARVRAAWLPLFDRYELDLAFEHHDHVFKRSYRLRNNQKDPDGTLYVGDGCFGVPPREIKDPNRFYLEKSASQPHFWLVAMSEESIRLQAITQDGQVFDDCTVPLSGPNGGRMDMGGWRLETGGRRLEAGGSI